MSPFLLRRLSDELLGSRLASGEAAAFDELYRRYVHRLAAYGAQLLGDASAGDDVAQASLLKAYTALRDGRVPDRFRPWLYRIAHNVAIDVVVRRREVPAEGLAEAPARTEHSAGEIVAALAALPDRQRRVYVLRELHGLRIDETGAALGLTAPQVEQSLFAARNRMAEHLSFGARLDCLAVRRLSLGPLDAGERRALKTHLRSCVGCRRELGARARALALIPAGAVDWLRALGSTLVGGSAPAAAKVGAAIATATIAAGVPGAAVDLARRQASVEPRFHGLPAAVEAPGPRPKRAAPRRVAETALAAVPAPAATRAAPAPVPVVVPRPREPERPVAGTHHDPGEREHPAAEVKAPEAAGPGSDDAAPAPAPAPVSAPAASSSEGPGESPAAVVQPVTTRAEVDGGGGKDGASSDDGDRSGSDGGGHDGTSGPS